MFSVYLKYNVGSRHMFAASERARSFHGASFQRVFSLRSQRKKIHLRSTDIFLLETDVPAHLFKNPSTLKILVSFDILEPSPSS